MDRNKSWGRRPVLILSLWLAGCGSVPSTDNPHSDALKSEKKNVGPLFCTGSNAADQTACAIVGGVMMLLDVISTPTQVGNPGLGGTHERKMAAKAISGRCEIVSPLIKPCDGVLLTLTSPGYARKAWITGHEFEVNGIKGAKVDIQAYSEEYNVVTTLKGVRAGSQIRIQLTLPPK